MKIRNIWCDLFVVLSVVLLLSTFVYAKMNPWIAGGGVPSGNACDDSACSGCTAQERFNCGSTDGNEELSWTVDSVGGTVTQDYSTAGMDMEGDDCLQVDRDDGTVGAYHDFTGTDNMEYVAWMMRFGQGTTSTDGLRTMKLYNSSTTNLCEFRFYWVDSDPDYFWLQFKYNSAGSTENVSGTHFLEETTYYFKCGYDNSGDNTSDVDVWYSTDGTSWNSMFTTDVGTDSAQFDRAWILNNGDNDPYFIDDVRIRTDGTDVGNY